MLTFFYPSNEPMANTEPTQQCVVETGKANLEAIITAAVDPSSMQQPLDGVILVISFPILQIILYPQVANPTTIPIPPKANIQIGMSLFYWT